MGKRVLLKASKIYRNEPVPEGEEEYLFQYSIVSINTDCKTAVIIFNKQYVLDGGYKFYNFAITNDDEEPSIPNYSLSLLDNDHEIYNEHLGRGNKIVNNQQHAKCKADEEAIVRDGNYVSDLKAKFDERIEAYVLMFAEFEPTGALMEHAITVGPKQGMMNIKELWKHKHSDYKFSWHRQYGKTSFVRDRLYKAVRAIINRQSTGSERLSLIMDYGSKPISSTDGHIKYPRDVDMVNHIGVVFASAGCKLPLSVFDNDHFRSYVRGLDKKRTPPHRLERLRVLEVMMDGGMMEFAKIIKVGHSDCEIIVLFYITYSMNISSC